MADERKAVSDSTARKVTENTLDPSRNPKAYDSSMRAAEGQLVTTDDIATSVSPRDNPLANRSGVTTPAEVRDGQGPTRDSQDSGVTAFDAKDPEATTLADLESSIANLSEADVKAARKADTRSGSARIYDARLTSFRE